MTSPLHTLPDAEPVPDDDWPVPVSDKESDLKAAEDVVRGDVPRITEGPDLLVRLPRGLYVNNTWEGEAEVRELTGNDEEALARFKEAPEIFNAVVVYGTSRIGSTDLLGKSYAERDALLGKLLLGEREQLFLNVARVTYGDTREFEEKCPQCETDLDTTLIISEDIKIREMETPFQVQRSYTTTKGRKVTYRLVTGNDQKLLLSRRGATAAEHNTILLSECIMQVDGQPVVDPEAFAKGLSMGDRRDLLTEMVEEQPSPTLSIEIPCPSCGFVLTLGLGWEHFFRF
jgi:hypothetical protein